MNTTHEIKIGNAITMLKPAYKLKYNPITTSMHSTPITIKILWWFLNSKAHIAHKTNGVTYIGLFVAISVPSPEVIETKRVKVAVEE